MINNKMADINTKINSNRIIRKKIQRKTLANINSKYEKELFNDIGNENHNNKKLNLNNYSQQAL